MSNIKSITTRTIIFALACLAVLPAIVVAHGGLEHVIGTVVKISDSSISVKTTTGKIVDVSLDEKTTFARAKQPIEKAMIKVGDRIVIHAAKVTEKLVARTVEIGVSPAPREEAH